MRKSLVSTIGLICLMWAATASAQPRWGHERFPDAGACFFENINFAGRYFCLRAGESLSSMPSGMNDKISSIRMFGGADVTVFRDRNMTGRSNRFGGEVPDLRRSGWNDQISSFEVGRVRGGSGRPDRGREPAPAPVFRGPAWGREAFPREGACFFRDRDFRGEYFCVPRGEAVANLGRDFNDSVSSIRVFGAGVRIFRDRDFRGRASDLRGDVRDLRGSWRDSISSIRVY